MLFAENLQQTDARTESEFQPVLWLFDGQTVRQPVRQPYLSDLISS